MTEYTGTLGDIYCQVETESAIYYAEWRIKDEVAED